MSPIDDNRALGLRYTDEFLKWREGLRDGKGLARIATRLERLEGGHWGDAQSVGGGVTELRLHFGPGYRLYVTRQGDQWVYCCVEETSPASDATSRSLKDWLRS